jgi:hypothetical protein
MTKNSPKILFNKQAIPYILEIFDKTINDEGYIVDSNNGDPILDPEHQPILAKEFGGIKKGSEIFLKNDIVTIFNIAEGKY